MRKRINGKAGLKKPWRAALCLGMLAAAARGAEGGLPKAASAFAVVELFTSEGCSSCPPADRLLAGLIAEAEAGGRPVRALSFHVDYWNYLGWSDPFSRAEFSRRQKLYSEALGSGVYTPQMIVNGEKEFTGSDARAARAAIAAALAKGAETSVLLAAGREADGRLRVDFRIGGASAGSVVNVALVEKGLSVPVRRGENGGRTLMHENVVRAFGVAKPDAEGRGGVRLEIPAGVDLEKSRVIGYVQDGRTLRITGATETNP
jgi:hypothetical protein